MAVNSDNNIIKICRLCMYEEKCNEDLNNVISVFNEEILGTDEKIKKCIHITLGPNDVIPPNICRRCKECLDEYYNFYEKCHKTNETLKSVFNVDSTSTACNDESQGDINHLSNEGNTYVPLKEYDVVYKNQTYITNIDYFSESSSTIPNKNNDYDSVETNTSKSKVLDGFVAKSESSDTTSSINTIERDTNVDRSNHFLYSCPKGSEEVADNKPFRQCNLNNRSSNNMCNMNVKTRRYSNRNKCATCCSRHNSKAVLEKRIKIRRGSTRDEQNFVCRTCGKKTNRYKTMRYRMVPQSVVKMYRCKYCKFSAKSITLLRAHVSKMHRVCKACSRCFKSELSLKQHERRVHQSKRYICNVCNRSFAEKHLLKRHIVKKHAPRKEYQCHVCGRDFCKAKQLRDHMRMHHEGYMTCPNCEKTFFDREHLERHLMRCMPGSRVEQYKKVAWGLKSTISLPNSSLKN